MRAGDSRNMVITQHFHLSVTLVILDGDDAVAEYAHSLHRAGVRLAVLGASAESTAPFATGSAALTLVADVDDPDQIARAITVVEERLGRVTGVIRYRSDLPAAQPVAA